MGAGCCGCWGAAIRLFTGFPRFKNLLAFAAARSNTLLYSPRRYGKTSLIKKVQDRLQSDGTLTAYCDLFGVSSTEEIAGKITRSIYSITQRNESLFKKSIRFLTSFRPVLSPSADGGIAISVQPAFKSGGLDLLDETLESLEKFIEDVSMPVHIVLDEFQEITEVSHEANARPCGVFKALSPIISIIVNSERNLTCKAIKSELEG